MADTFEPFDLLTIAASAGAGVAGGFYMAFSAVVMPALRLRQPQEAVATMNLINRHAVKAPFMTVFFGTAAASAAVGLEGVASGDARGIVRSLGAGLYLSGFVLTVVHNVPLNNRLAAVGAGEAAAIWPHWERSWTRGNTWRGLVSTAGALLLAAGR